MIFDHGSRRQAIVEAVLGDVFAGRLRSGQHLVTRELAQRFGVSDTPIREALVALAGIGVIELLPNRGAVVRSVTVKDVRDICQLRRALECEAVRIACGRVSADELASIGDELRHLQSLAHDRTAKFSEQARAADSRLHDLVMTSSGNHYLASDLNRLKLLYRAFRDLNYTQDEVRNDRRRLLEEAGEHLAIVDALVAGDRAAAVKAMSKHVRTGAKYWCQAIKHVTRRNGETAEEKNNESGE
jgi:DNA-binding GntR family transcriptional regulator